MKLKELLATGDFDCELCCDKTYESTFSFCWNKDTKLTEYGQNVFSKIMNSEVKTFTSPMFGFTISLLDESITEEEYDFFMSACAGYIPDDEYQKIFMEVRE